MQSHRWTIGGLAALCVGLVAAGCTSYAGEASHPALVTPPIAARVTPPARPAGAFPATVLRAVDGDTFLARRGSHARRRVRLIGIDAPESVQPGTRVQCFGPEAAAALHDLLPNGARISAAYQGQPHRDRFGRELWDVWLPDGGFLQGRLVQAGAVRARVYRPQHRYADTLDQLEDTARAARLGLHGAC